MMRLNGYMRCLISTDQVSTPTVSDVGRPDLERLRLHSRRKRSVDRGAVFPNVRNDKALNNRGFVVHKMAEAMGFELMGLLQTTVFKSEEVTHDVATVIDICFSA